MISNSSLRRFTLACVIALVGCGGDSSSSPTDGGTPDLKRVVDLTGPRSGVGAACETGRGPHGTCKGDDSICFGDGEFGFKGGYCSQRCNSVACPSDAECVKVAGGFDICLALCNSDADCRTPGYVCTDYQACVPVGGIYLGSEVRPGTNAGAACVQPTVAPPNGSPFEPNQQLSTITGGEVHLAVDELRGTAVAAWIQLYGTQSIGVVSSQDGGASWSAPSFLPLPTSIDHNDAQSDPVVAVDSEGRYFITWIGFNGNTGAGFNVYVARSEDGGITFPDLFLAAPKTEFTTAAFLDKPWIAVGPDDSIYITWSAIVNPQGNAVIRIARSTDHGQSWSAPVTVTPDDSVFHNLAEVAVAQDGTVYVANVELNASNFGDPANKIALQRFSSALVPEGGRIVLSKGADSPPFDEPSLAVDGNNVYVAFASGTAAGDWDIRVVASHDRGVTVLPSVKANDDASCATHLHPGVAVDGAGKLHVVFYDNRYLEGALMHTASAGTGTLSFAQNTFVNDKPFGFTTERNAIDWLGDYVGITAHGNHVYVVWTDPRVNQTSQIFFSRAGF